MYCEKLAIQFVLLQVPQNIPCYVFDQVNPPGNYDPGRFGPWEPSRILLIPEIPSKNRGTREYKIVLLYVPTSQPLIYPNWMGYRQPGAQRIKAVCCGPSQANCCPVGARTASPCAHGAACLYAGCCLASNPQMFVSTHSNLNLMDPGSGLPAAYVGDLLAGTIR